jgi:hypothetical protein
LGRSAANSLDFLARAAGLAAAFAAALSLSGCGGIEFQGKLFDYAGLSGSGQKGDVRMTERSPLMIPPDHRRLPPPGSPPITRADWPVDSDMSRKQAVAAKEKDDQKREASLDPSNPYAGKPTLLDKMLGKKKSSDEEDREAVPEPDASDKTPQDRARAQASNTQHKAVDQSMNAPTVAPEDDPFHQDTPKSYEGMSKPKGNDANY